MSLQKSVEVTDFDRARVIFAFGLTIDDNDNLGLTFDGLRDSIGRDKDRGTGAVEEGERGASRGFNGGGVEEGIAIGGEDGGLVWGLSRGRLIVEGLGVSEQG